MFSNQEIRLQFLGKHLKTSDHRLKKDQKTIKIKDVIFFRRPNSLMASAIDAEAQDAQDAQDAQVSRCPVVATLLQESHRAHAIYTWN